MELPFHLRKYIQKQEASKYTPVDQAVWRFVLRQLKTFLQKNAHESYVDGLEATGISIEEIPSIERISKHLEKFGWRAAPVSGFIPPSAFMEMQARKLLPIAADMRTLNHLMYTPAPDIVHEAAGHAPMVANPEFRKYLENYATVANKAIISKKDLDLYSAIRELSDIKEHPNSTKEDVQKTQEKLDRIAKNMGDPSEASKLSRMAWWTTEYGLIGHNNPKIYGAGLLSSAGESRLAMTEKVRKIPLSLDCVNYTYDITEMQPQLFVTESFEFLNKVLFEFSDTMAYKRGGMYGLKKSFEAQTVNTIELNSGIQIGGKLKNIIEQDGQPIYLQFEGECQLAFDNKELSGQGRKRHAHGFSCPIGKIKKSEKGRIVWESGVELSGSEISEIQKNGQTILKIFKDCRVSYQNKDLYNPEWGEFDLVLGEEVVSVYAGAPDREAYGENEDFIAALVPEKKYSEKDKELFLYYQKIRDLRKNLKSKTNVQDEISSILNVINEKFSDDWLLKLEILEISYQLPSKIKEHQKLDNELVLMAEKFPDKKSFILDGLKIANQAWI